LELSGIGDKERLDALNIPVQKHLPGVGENLQDHLTINILQGLHGVTTFYEETRPHHLIKNIFKFLFRRKGLLTHPAAQAGLFFRTDEEQTRPMAQVHFAPAASEADGKGNLKTAPGTTATVCQLRPESRGSVHINSTDPEKHPNIKANYLATDSDKKTLIAAVRKVRDVFDAPALDRYRGEEFKPGRHSQSDEEILAYIRAEAESVYHPVGTCKMGKDKMSVVNDRLQVKGIKSLRIADASIMPTIISGNTNATSIVIGEKCADMILQDAKKERTTK
jgi:choline dehydrogenase